MKDGELDALYVKKREQLKELVASKIRPKVVQGKFLNGKEFVSFLEQVNITVEVLWIFYLIFSHLIQSRETFSLMLMYSREILQFLHQIYALVGL